MNKKTAATAAAAATAAFIIFTVYKCPIRYVSGFPCPGCGMTRACIMVFFDIKNAFFMHPLFPVAAIVPLSLIKPCRSFFAKHNEHFTQIIVFLLIAVYIWRMLMFFPNPPMEYEEKNLLEMILGGI